VSSSGRRYVSSSRSAMRSLAFAFAGGLCRRVVGRLADPGLGRRRRLEIRAKRIDSACSVLLAVHKRKQRAEAFELW
jgi:nitrate/nitrite transporter NarK